MIILQSPLYGDQTDYAIAAVKRWPDRFAGFAWVDAAKGVEAANHLEGAVGAGLLGLEIELAGELAFNPDFSFLGEAEMAVWARLDALHRPLALHLSGGGRGVREAGEVRQLLERFPNLDVVILHIGWPDKVLDATWQKRVLLAKHDWVHLDLAALPVAFNAEGYPYPGGRAALRWSIDQVGADKIMWGSDYPLVRKYCTYPRTLEFLRGPGSGLTEDEQAAIFGDNATRLLADWESR